MPKFLDERMRTATAGTGLEAQAGRRLEIRQDRNTSAARRQDGGHPHRLRGSDGGAFISEHHRTRTKEQ